MAIRLTEERRALLQARLDEAEEVLHLFATGQHTVTLKDGAGQERTFNAADQDKLERYLDSLRRQLGIGGSRLYIPGYGARSF